MSRATFCSRCKLPAYPGQASPPLPATPCPHCGAYARWTEEEENLYGFVGSWFTERYVLPAGNLPTAADGSPQWIWGGPYDAQTELQTVWQQILTADFLTRVAARLCKDAPGLRWSGMPPRVFEVAPRGHLAIRLCWDATPPVGAPCREDTTNANP